MFDRTTDKARLSLLHAQDEARALGHYFVGTEHLLIAIARSDSPAASLLSSFGIDADIIREMVRTTVREGSGKLSGDITLSAFAQQALMVAGRAADTLAHKAPITTLHLLFGIVKIENSAAVNVLEKLGVSKAKALKDVQDKLERLGTPIVPGSFDSPVFKMSLRMHVHSDTPAE